MDILCLMGTVGVSGILLKLQINLETHKLIKINFMDIKNHGQPLVL